VELVNLVTDIAIGNMGRPFFGSYARIGQNMIALMIEGLKRGAKGRQDARANTKEINPAE
jgi:hypothetical protein